MCYTLKTSIFTFIINIIFCISLYLYAKNNQQLKVVSLFFLYVGVMQFWDMIFWIYKPDTKINKYATKMAMLWNHFEPIVLYLLIVFIMKKNDAISTTTFITYSILMLIYSIANWNKIQSTGVYYRNEIKNSLFWEWNYMPGSIYFYSIFLLTLLILTYKNMTGWIRDISLFFIVFTFFFSLYKYQIDKSVGRFWCYFAAYGPIFFIFLNFIINSTQKSL